MVDHASNFSYSHLSRGASNAETLSAKGAYKRVTHAYSYNTEAYHGDNSRFDLQDFKDSCGKAQETYSYCEVGAHHQNTIAEATNKRLSHRTRTILLHAKRKWPCVITSISWPFCYKCTEECHNLLDLNSDGLSPVEVLLGHTEDIVADDFHTWGCPVNVAPVLSLQTGHVNPQYHIVFDDEFSTVPYLQSSETPPNWTELVTKHTKKATDQAFNLASTWYEGEEAVRGDTMPQTS
eukprot:10983950-Ditylum_brightwellii.AAC.1